MERSRIDPGTAKELDQLAAEADAVRTARLRRDLALTPPERLDKLAALCRQTDLLRGARRMS